jgi:hypothetical protein
MAAYTRPTSCFQDWLKHTEFFIFMSGGNTVGVDPDYFRNLHRESYDPISAARQFMWDHYNYHPQKEAIV